MFKSLDACSRIVSLSWRKLDKEQSNRWFLYQYGNYRIISIMSEQNAEIQLSTTLTKSHLTLKALFHKAWCYCIYTIWWHHCSEIWVICHIISHEEIYFVYHYDSHTNIIIQLLPLLLHISVLFYFRNLHQIIIMSCELNLYTTQTSSIQLTVESCIPLTHHVHIVKKNAHMHDDPDSVNCHSLLMTTICYCFN